MSYRVEWMPFAIVMGLVTLLFVPYLGLLIALVMVVLAAAAAVAALVAPLYLLGRSVLRHRRARTDPDRPRRPAFGRFAAIQPALERAGREVPRSGVAPPGGPSPSSPGNRRRRIGARVRVSHLERPGHREELEGVVVGRQKYGVNVRLPDGTIRGFSDVEVSPAEPESPGGPTGAAAPRGAGRDLERRGLGRGGRGRRRAAHRPRTGGPGDARMIGEDHMAGPRGEDDWLARISELFADTSLTPVSLRVRSMQTSVQTDQEGAAPSGAIRRLPSADASGPPEGS